MTDAKDTDNQKGKLIFPISMEHTSNRYEVVSKKHGTVMQNCYL